MKNKLLIVWSSGEKEVAKKLVLLYGSVILSHALQSDDIKVITF